MRILHTSDWHIGRSFHGHSTLEALRGVLDAMVEQVRDHAVDVVVVSGDVFDSATPAAECYTLLTDVLVKIRAAGARVVMTSGNHDSAARLGFQADLLRASDVHVITDARTVGTPTTFVDDEGPVHIYGIPYLEPAHVRGVWPGLALRSQAQTMAHAMTLVRADMAERSGRSIVLAHCFAAGVDATPGLEREVRRGSLDVVPLSTFDDVDYVALGHIHGRQQLSARVRYAGAPLHYGFGEAAKPRGSWLVDLDSAGDVTAEWLSLPVPRPLVTLRGSFEELLDDPAFAAHSDDWVCAVYTDTTPQIDPMRRLLARFPHCATVVHAPEGRVEGAVTTYGERLREAVSDADRIDAFLAHVREGESASAREAELIHEVLDEGALAEASV